MSIIWASQMMPKICPKMSKRCPRLQTIRSHNNVHGRFVHRPMNRAILCVGLVAPSNRLEEDRRSLGRPVFKKADGEPRFLFVRDGTSNYAWAISDSIKYDGAFVISGRATNSPTSAVAGISVREGVNSWRFKDNKGKWVESYGDIAVTCALSSRVRREVNTDEAEEGEWLEGDIGVTGP